MSIRPPDGPPKAAGRQDAQVEKDFLSPNVAHRRQVRGSNGDQTRTVDDGRSIVSTPAICLWNTADEASYQSKEPICSLTGL